MIFLGMTVMEDGFLLEEVAVMIIPPQQLEEVDELNACRRCKVETSVRQFLNHGIIVRLYDGCHTIVTFKDRVSSQKPVTEARILRWIERNHPGMSIKKAQQAILEGAANDDRHREDETDRQESEKALGDQFDRGHRYEEAPP